MIGLFETNFFPFNPLPFMRYPSVAGRFYPSDRQDLFDSIESCFKDRLGPGMPSDTGSTRSIRGAMVPHAGYMASGAAAAHVYRAIKEDGLPDAYVIVGPDHYGTSPGNSLCAESHLTPLGECAVHEDICSRIAESVPNIPVAHSREHSIEVQVPFIQFIDPSPHIVPIMMGDQSPESARRLSASIEDACEGYDVIVIASSDMSHYVPKAVAERLDGMVLDRVAGMDVPGMYEVIRRNRISMCGYGPVATVMNVCSDTDSKVILHTDSYDSLGYDPGSVVGYGAALFGDFKNNRCRFPSMEENQEFCVRCGHYLTEGAQFCPECGLRVPGRSPEQVEAEKEQIRSLISKRLDYAAILMLIYSVPFLIVGAYLVLDLNGVVQMLLSNPTYADLISSYGLTESELHDFLMWSSVAYIASSAMGIVSAVLCHKRRMYWLALSLCVMSMLTGVAGFIAMMMALGAFWMILSSKMAFREYESRFEEELSRML